VLATSAFAQTSQEVRSPLTFLPTANEPAPKHLHVTVDDLPWHWGDFSDKNLVTRSSPGRR
jgi:hypothetical protein